MRGMRLTQRWGTDDRQRSRPRPAHPSGDEGMTLIELMWAMVVFAIAATGIAFAMIAATNGVRLDRDRIQAANLAARELEITRSEFMNSATGATTLGATTIVVNPHALPAGTAAELNQFVVTRTVQWIPAGTGTSSCDGGATVEYPSLAVDVKVTWPRMESVKPVESHTVLTPPKGSLNSNLGFVGIKVLRADGTPASGQAVNLTGPSSATNYTADDGCAVFALSTMGTYTAGVATTGYVDNFGVAAPSKAVVVQAGKLTQASFNYDAAARITLTAKAPSGGYSLPTTLPAQFQMYNTGIMPSGLKTVALPSATTTVTGLWPFADGYSLWPGSCTQSDPVKAGGTRAANTVVAPGGSANADLNFLPVSVTVLNNTGAALAGKTVIATPASTLGCTAPELSGWVVGTTNSSGVLQTSLPAGAWTIQVSGKTALSTWPSTGDLAPPAGAATVVAQISTAS